ncbi:MAG: tetratricopeptide repeat protein [Planctomycetota bacterium]|jgi:tetratricopeptide (TPR) repeat protein|nr:tetratricopeptide repeat protein [Planctomycetota bacterium]MDP7248770.1 tetratricopeptide repeat protein [Planctomycetota bacterium]
MIAQTEFARRFVTAGCFLTTAMFSIGLSISAELEPTREFLLFENGELIKESTGRLSSIFSRKAKLRLAIERMETLIEQYPDSPHRSEAAYLIAESYNSLREYKTAAENFLQCYEFDKETDRDALYRAAEITDKKLKNQSKAYELYERVVKHSPHEKDRAKASKRMDKLLESGFGSKPAPKEKKTEE